MKPLLIATVAALAAALPQLSAEMAPVTLFAREMACSNVSISPDGKTIAFVAGIDENETHHVLIFLDLATGKTAMAEAPRNWHDDDNAEQVEDVDWLTADRAVMTFRRPDGRDGGMAALDRDGKQWTELWGVYSAFFVPGDSATFFALGRADGDSDNPVVYSVDGSPRHESKDIQPRAETTASHYGVIADDSEGMNEWVLDRQGRVRVGIAYDGEETKVICRDNDDAPWVRLHEFDSRGLGGYPMGIDWDGHTAYTATLTKYGTWGVSTYDLATRKMGSLIAADPTYDILSPSDYMESRAYLIFSRKNQKLVGLRYPTDVYKTLWIDPGMAQVQAAMNRAFPGAINTIRDWSDDETKVVIASWSDRHPSIYYLLDRNTHKLRKLFDSAPWITPSVAGRTYPLSYRTHDGLVVHGYITLPPGSTGKNLPMVVIANTGLIFERTSLSYDSFIQLLANHGYAVLRVNPRGTPGYGEAFFEAGRKQAGRAIQNDITEAVQWAIEKGIADPHRIAITGADYGGFSAEWGLVNTPDLYRCGVSIEGICDWMAYLKFFDTGISFVKRSGADMNKGLYGYLKNEVGDVKEDAAMLRDISPVNHVDRIKAPMLLFCSKEVYRQFQYDQTQEFADALKSHGAAYNITVFPKVDDSTDWYKNRLAMFTQILAFLDKNMK